jgi:hypothetical protein
MQSISGVGIFLCYLFRELLSEPSNSALETLHVEIKNHRMNVVYSLLGNRKGKSRVVRSLLDKRWSITYIRPNDAALSPQKVLYHAKYALIASFLLDTASVFAAAIGVIDGSSLTEMIQHNITLGFRDIVHFLLTPETGYTRFSIGYTNKVGINNTLIKQQHRDGMGSDHFRHIYDDRESWNPAEGRAKSPRRYNPYYEARLCVVCNCHHYYRCDSNFHKNFRPHAAC